jgi:hypothetical protein
MRNLNDVLNQKEIEKKEIYKPTGLIITAKLSCVDNTAGLQKKEKEK